MRSITVMLFASSLLAGCAATGPTFTEHLAASNAIPPSSARLVVFRTRDSDQYSARSAVIRIDGNSLGSCDYAGFSVFDVKPGKYLLNVDMRGAIGTCDLPVEVTAGKDYYLEIKPRTEHFVSGVIGGLVGTALESSGRQCGGAFSVESVPRDIALPRLTNLRMTK